jgi:hypothetical protein
MPNSQTIGSTGELIAQARLLVRGWLVGNINTGGMRNAPAIDLIAAKGSRTLRFAVKATGHNSNDVQWSAKFGWDSLFKGDTKPDYVIFVWFNSKIDIDSCRVFIVPAKIVDRDVREQHEYWHKHTRRDGKPHKQSDHVSISWLGADTMTNIARNFQNKWKKYEDNWDQLEK